MASEKKQHPVCNNCGQPALFRIEGDEDGTYFNLCLDCNLKFEQAETLKFDRLARHYNKVAGQFEANLGVPGMVQRFQVPVREPLIQTGDTTLNNIHIDSSTIGVLNTGSIETVDSAVTVLTNAGKDEGATALRELTEAVAASTEARDDQKNEIIEILSVLATEATAPPEKRRGAAMGALISQVAAIIGSITGLGSLWDRVGPAIKGLFGM